MSRMRIRRIGAAIAVLTVWAALPGAVAATVTNQYYVNKANPTPSSPYTSWTTAATNIQDAVNRAQVDLGPGTNCIVWVTNGLYRVPSQVEMSKAITLRSVKGKAVTTIDGRAAGRCVLMRVSGTVLDGFTVSNGYLNVNDFGAGILVTNGTVKNCSIVRNRTGTAGGTGGGVCAIGATVTNCLIARNRSDNLTAVTTGGGVYALSSATVVDCVISSNQAKYGGGLHLQGSTLRDCEVSYNNAYQSGGIRMLTGTAENDLVIGNEASNVNGGIGCSRNTEVVRNCTIVGNKAGTADSGGLYLSLYSGGYASAVNTIVWGNQAVGVDSNIEGYTNNASYSCAPELGTGIKGNVNADPQFTDWDATHGYGNVHARGDYTLKITSPCIDSGTSVGAPNHDLAHNSRPKDGKGDGGAEYDMGCYEAPDASLGPLDCGFSTTPPKGAAPLQVVFSASLSGNTTGARYRWSFGDGGTNNWSSHSVVTNVYAAAAVYRPVLTVTNAAGERASKTNTVTVYPLIAYVARNGRHLSPFDSWAKAATNIQDAVDAAGDGYSTVLISNGTYRLRSQVNVAKNITVRGWHGAAATFVDGGYPRYTNRCFRVIGPAVLDGLTISNGLANGTPVEPNSYGGGVYVSNATLQNCAVTLNRGGSGGYGAGVYGLRSTVKGCTISRNVHVGESWYGGGTAGGLNVTAGYTPVIRNTIAYGNQAAGVAADISDVATQFCGRCCSPDLKEGVNGNISASPRLVSAGSDYGLSHVRGDYELTKNSPCFNTGVTLPWMSGATDLAGKPRLLPTQAPLADMGAFEMIPPPAGNLLIVR